MQAVWAHTILKYPSACLVYQTRYTCDENFVFGLFQKVTKESLSIMPAGMERNKHYKELIIKNLITI